MACAILPSETARLVYGYLVKENLNEIALQFLEKSPYLMDCFQVVKSGYQFNTKLMGKDLQELLQEYSVIHNLVNTKVSSLSKTSILYKRIKLRCESLAEILELILFWKNKINKSEENSVTSEKSERNENSKTENKIECMNNSEVSNTNIVAHEGNCNDYNERNIVSSENNVPENYHSNSSCEINLEKESSIQDSQVNNHETHSKEENSMLMQIQISDIVENCNLSKNDNNNSKINGNSVSDNNETFQTKLNENPTVLSVDSSSHCENMIMGSNPSGSLVHNDVANEFDSHIKIVEIEEQHNIATHAMDIYSKPLEDVTQNVNLENSSVVFVSPEVGNVTIDQERNQIIVIPIDYYKSQDEVNARMEISESEKQTLNENKDIIDLTEVSSIPNSDQLYTDKISNVDENIITEKDFLKNRHLMSDVEKELQKSESKSKSTSQQQQHTLSMPYQESNTAPLNPIPAPVIVVSQAVIQTKPPRYRTILPKEKDPVPIVVVQPLLENNKDLTSSRCVKPKVNKTNCQSNKERVSASRKKRKESEKNEHSSLPAATTAPTKVASEKVGSETNTQELGGTIAPAEEPMKVLDVEKTTEEKENVEKGEQKKTETPVFFTKRNSKKLSLSTPRRKSHIRALEFETPPKTSEERKKSKTSPKIKFEHNVVERKSVRNTLFKSPIPETSFKSPVSLNESKKPTPKSTSKSPEMLEPLNELSIPIATRSPNTKLSDAWESLTGVGCVIGQTELPKKSTTTKMWDADLRCFIPENTQGKETLEKKRIRKPEKNHKDNRKTTKKKIVSKKSKPTPEMVSPSKISLTAKRNTYSINGNEEGSPIRSLFDDLKLVTPFKDIETIRSTEETPLTKLLRENINTIDIDLSMINTPSFPPTPSIIITPDQEDALITGTNYYSPSKDYSKDKVLKITDYYKVDSEKDNKKENKEMHEKVIDDLVSKAKEIIGIGKENQEENALKRRPSGKILSMVKIQMLTQCDKKLCENIPINEETTFGSHTTIIGNLHDEGENKHNLKDELEEKRKRALKKIKVVKENFNQAKSRAIKSRKRKRSGNTSKSDKSKSDISSESLGEKQEGDSGESLKKDCRLFHSTPYAEKNVTMGSKKDFNKQLDSQLLESIRLEFPPFEDNAEKYPELTEKSRKKLHFVESFLKLPEIVNFVTNFDDNHPKLVLKSSLRKFFQVFYKWLKHPHKREVNASAETKALLQDYLSVFEKINLGLNQNHRHKKVKKDTDVTDSATGITKSLTSRNSSGKFDPSDDEEREWKKREKEKRKDEETEDGVASTLPLKKRKATVKQVEIKNTNTPTEKDESKNNAENVSQTQSFLQDIDVDRFLSQIHGQENSRDVMYNCKSQNLPNN